MWDPNLLLIFNFITVVVLIVSSSVVLRPFFKRLAEVMDRYLNRNAADPSGSRQLEAVQDQLETMSQRLTLVEERLEFTESLVSREEERTLARGSGESPTPGGEGGVGGDDGT